MQTMSRQRWLEFVHAGTRTGKLAVTRSTGGPHVTPIWFLIDETPTGDQIVFTTGATSVKARALHRDPRLALCVDDQQPPYSYVLLEAEATLSSDLDDLLTWATRLAARYMGPDLADQYGRRNAVPGELLVRAPISRVTAYADIAD